MVTPAKLYESLPLVPSNVSVPAPISISDIFVKEDREKLSSPLDPKILLLPEPPSTLSEPLSTPSNTKSSSPEPPFNVSLPLPPINISLALEPVITSFPSNPKNLCGVFMSSGTRVSFPAVPVTTLNTRSWKVAVSVNAPSDNVYVTVAIPEKPRLSAGGVYVHVPSPLSTIVPSPAPGDIAIISSGSFSISLSLTSKSDSVIIISASPSAVSL